MDKSNRVETSNIVVLTSKIVVWLGVDILRWVWNTMCIYLSHIKVGNQLDCLNVHWGWASSVFPMFFCVHQGSKQDLTHAHMCIFSADIGCEDKSTVLYPRILVSNTREKEKLFGLFLFLQGPWSASYVFDLINMVRAIEKKPFYLHIYWW